MSRLLIELTHKLLSPDNKIVLKAVEELRVRGFLMDGSLRNMALCHANLQGADLMEADLAKIDFHQVHMAFADLSKANLAGAQLDRADLHGANFSLANLEGADLFKTNLLNAHNLTEQQLATCKRLIGATMPDGSIYDGRYNLAGDIEFMKWARIAPGETDKIATMLGVTVETYLKGQEMAKSYSEKGKVESRKVLVIDDDPDIVFALRTTLQSAGYDVLDARNGTEALDILADTLPDVIILDVMMDTPTEGFELAKKLNADARYTHLPILMLTSVSSTTPLQKETGIEDLPVEMFIDKPVDPESVLKKVNFTLARLSVAQPQP